MCFFFPSKNRVIRFLGPLATPRALKERKESAGREQRGRERGEKEKRERRSFFFFTPSLLILLLFPSRSSPFCSSPFRSSPFRPLKIENEATQAHHRHGSRNWCVGDESAVHAPERERERVRLKKRLAKKNRKNACSRFRTDCQRASFLLAVFLLFYFLSFSPRDESQKNLFVAAT